MTGSAGLGDVRSVEVADVYKAGRLAGRLRRENDDVTFAYTRSYLADTTTAPVAFSLPKTAAVVRAGAGSVPPFFAGLLPEGVRLTAVTSAIKTSVDDHLSILLALGGDTIGDVQVVPEGHTPVDPPPLFDGADTTNVDFTNLFSQATSTDWSVMDTAALPGIQVKTSAQMVSTPVTTAAGPAILKLEAPAYAFLVDNENFFLDMAHDCALRVPHHWKIMDKNGRKALLIARFDRVIEPAGVRRVAQEDACQVLGRYPAAKYRLSLQEAIKGLADAIAPDDGEAHAAAVLELLEIAAFSYLIGNGDLHGKNLSIRRNPTGTWEVTPAYDLLTTQPYLAWKDPMALSLYGRAAKIHHRWWVEAAVRLGVPARAIGHSLARITDTAQAWVNRVPEIGFDEKTSHRLADMLSQRCVELRPAEEEGKRHRPVIFGA